MADRWDLRVLGPLEMWIGALPVSLGGPQQRLVLALLVVSEDRLTTEQLITAVWPEDPPGSARKTVQVHISRLRGQLGGDAGPLQPVHKGYGFTTTGGRVDALAFEQSVADGAAILLTDPADAATRFHHALGLWTGEAYADLPEAEPIRAERARLAELRLVALERRIEAEMRLGWHRELIGELEALTIEHPYRERFVAQLMVSLYRSGRQADALHALQRARRTLDTELGIEPGAELRTLEYQLLNQDPTLDAPSAAPARTQVIPRSPPTSGGATTPTTPGTVASVRGYELREVVAEGESTVLYRAYQASVGREVAITVIRPAVANDSAFIRNFEARAQLVAQLEHPHIVTLYDYWREPEGAYLVMRWLPGGSLARTVEQGPQPVTTTLRSLEQLGQALSYAHRHGVVHGHVSADTVMLDDDDNAYLSGFGIEPASTGGGAPRSSQGSGNTPTTSPSDQASCSKPLSEATDVHGLAALAYELLTGKRPKSDGGMDERLEPAIRSVLSGALSADAERRPQRVEYFLRALGRAAGIDSLGAADAEPLPFVDVRNPYKGLRAFQRSDTGDFYGREKLVARLVNAFSQRRLVVVVGPSGSGKSSVVRAGLLPRVVDRPGDDPVLATEMVPGGQPFRELATALLRVAVDRPHGVLADLTADDRGLLRVVKQVLPDPHHELVLVIDQFEEIFSLVDSREIRDRFLDVLVCAVSDPLSRIRVVATLRADFFDRPLEHPAFGELLRLGLVAVTTPTREELAQAIAQPAAAVGLDLEPGLTQAIVADVVDQPGGLPLLQYAMTELFRVRQANRLAFEDYRRIGGVVGALGTRAEELYLHLDDMASHVARQVFLRLVYVDDAADDIRRRVRLTDLVSLDLDRASLDLVLDRFGKNRLLSFDRDPLTRGPTIEVAHEALLREWQRLRRWIEARRADLIVHRRFAAAVEEWERSGRDDSYLAQGGRLEQFETQRDDGQLALNRPEQQFLEASQEKRTAVGLREQRHNRRLRQVLVAVTVFAIAAVIAGAFARRQQIRAAEARFAAETGRLVADAPVVADTNLQLGLLLAAEAYRREPGPQALGALQRVLARADGFLGYVGEGRRYVDLAWTADGRVVAAATDGLVLIDPADGTVRELVDLAAISQLAVSPAEPRAAVLSTGSPTIRLVDLATADVVELALPSTLISDAASTVAVVAFSPDGTHLAAGTFAGDVVLWEVSSGRLVWRHRAHPETEIPYETSPHEPLRSGLGTTHLAFSPDGRYLATAGLIYVRVWDLEQQQRIGADIEVFRTAARGEPVPVAPLAIGLGDDRVATVATGWGVLDFDLETGAVLRETRVPDSLGSVGSTAQVIEAVLNDRGATLTVTGGRTVMLDVDGGTSREFDALVPGRASAALHPDQARLAVAGNGRVSLWSLAGEQLLATPVPIDLEDWDGGDVSSDGDLAVVGSVDGQTGAIWDLSSTPPRLLADDVFALIRPPDDQLWTLDLGENPVPLHRIDPVTLAPIGPTFHAPTAWEMLGPVDGWVAVPGATSDPVVRIFDAGSGQLRQTLEFESVDDREGIGTVDISPDRSRLVATTPGGWAAVWDTRSWDRVATLSEGGGQISGAAYTPTGEHLVTTASDGTLVVRDAATFRRIGDSIATGTGAAAGADVLHVGADGRLVALTGFGIAQLWDLEAGVQIGGDFPADPGTAAAVDDNVRHLLSIVGEHALIWDIDLASWADTACRAAGRNLTEEEWAQYLPNDPYRATCTQWPAAEGRSSDGRTEP